MKDIPLWITELEADELKFIRNFVLASGSLKEMCSWAQSLWPTGLVALQHVESSRSRYQVCVPYIARCILYHWTTGVGSSGKEV